MLERCLNRDWIYAPTSESSKSISSRAKIYPDVMFPLPLVDALANKLLWPLPIRTHPWMQVFFFFQWLLQLLFICMRFWSFSVWLSPLCLKVITICWPRKLSVCFSVSSAAGGEGHSDRTVTHYQCLCHTLRISNLGHWTMRSCLNSLVLSVSSGSQSVSGTLINRSSQANSPTVSYSSAQRQENIAYSTTRLWSVSFNSWCRGSNVLFYLPTLVTEEGDLLTTTPGCTQSF